MEGGNEWLGRPAPTPTPPLAWGWTEERAALDLCPQPWAWLLASQKQRGWGAVTSAVPVPWPLLRAMRAPEGCMLECLLL